MPRNDPINTVVNLIPDSAATYSVDQRWFNLIYLARDEYIRFVAEAGEKSHLRSFQMSRTNHAL